MDNNQITNNDLNKSADGQTSGQEKNLWPQGSGQNGQGQFNGQNQFGQGQFNGQNQFGGQFDGQPQFNQFNQGQFGGQNQFGQGQFGGQPQFNQFGQSQFGGQNPYLQGQFNGQNQFGGQFNGQNQFGGPNQFVQPQFGGQGQFGGQNPYGQGQFNGQPQFGQPAMMMPEYGQQYFQQPQFGQNGPSNGTKTSGKRKKIAIISIASVLAVAGIVIAILMIFGKSGKGAKTSEEAAKEFLQVWAAHDVDKMIQYSLPDDLKSAAEKYIKSTDYTYYNKSVGSLKEAYEYSYCRHVEDDTQIRNLTTEVVRKAEKSEIEESEEYIKAVLGTKVDIEEIVRVKVRFEYKGGQGYYSEKWYDESERFDVYKTDGKWYVFPEYIID